MEPTEIVEVDPGDEISCDGGKTYGHPRVYLSADEDGRVDCYYCGRRFQVRMANANEAGGKHQGAV